jgi:hypothetical protein
MILAGTIKAGQFLPYRDHWDDPSRMTQSSNLERKEEKKETVKAVSLTCTSCPYSQEEGPRTQSSGLDKRSTRVEVSCRAAACSASGSDAMTPRSTAGSVARASVARCAVDYAACAADAANRTDPAHTGVCVLGNHHVV